MTVFHLHPRAAARIFTLMVKEIGFQLLLHAAVFTLYMVYDDDCRPVSKADVVFFILYATAAGAIGYPLLKRLYRKQYINFFVGTLGVLMLVVCIEEVMLEPLFYPGTNRANVFPGFWYTVTGILPPITLLVGGKLAFDALRHRLGMVRAQALARQTELRYLSAQMSPHFLFNHLNNLYVYAREGSPRTPELILGMSDNLRYALYESRLTYVPLHRDLEQLRHYVNLMELQIEDRGRVRFRQSGESTGWRIAPLLLQVFVENAFKHSTQSQENHIEIDVSTKISARGLLQFYCRNTFRPVKADGILDRGIGLQNVRRRLALLYPARHELIIEAAVDVYVARLQLQLDPS